MDPATNKYIISDPTGVRERGYVDPATGQPYPSSQPYLGNLLEAFKDDIKDGLSKTVRPNNNFDRRDMNFWHEFMAHEYPNRARHQYWNSATVRKLMSSKP